MCSTRAAVLGVVAACAAATADTTIGFDNVFAPALIGDQYRSLGVVFHGNWQVQGPGPATNPVSGINSIAFYDPDNQQNNYTVSVEFVIPGTSTPATTQSVAFTPTDASQGNTLISVRAYNPLGFEIAHADRLIAADGLYNPAVDTPLVVNAPAGQAIATVEFSVAIESVGSGNRVIEGDDFFFGTLSVPPCGPADVGSVGATRGADHILDNNDFIVFVDLFFASDPLADRGSTGAVPGADGAFDNNDFIVFIDQFFAGC